MFQADKPEEKADRLTGTVRGGTEVPLTSTSLIDLHLHSLFSDGTLSPRELVGKAADAGLHSISLTDHETVAGLAECRSECRSSGIGFVPGLELSIGHGQSEIHLLGYGIDPHNRQLCDILDQLGGEREERMEKMVRRLNSLGVPAEMAGIRRLAGGKILSRLHLATFLLKMNFVESREEAFQLYIGDGRPAYVRRHRLTLKDGIDLIIGSGGVAVLAHPGVSRRDSLIDYLVRTGIRGIEVFYPKHSPGDVARYLKLCRRYDLIATGGSDYHGSSKPETSIGLALTPPAELEKIFKCTKS